MAVRTRFALLAAAVSLAAFFLTKVLWPDPAGMDPPPAALTPYFLFLAVVESAAFGAGVAFLWFGRSHFSERAGEDLLPFLAYIATGWSLVSWWPHDNMHRVNLMGDFAGLLLIEVLFHFTLIVAAFVIALALWDRSRADERG